MQTPEKVEILLREVSVMANVAAISCSSMSRWRGLMTMTMKGDDHDHEDNTGNSNGRSKNDE